MTKHSRAIALVAILVVSVLAAAVPSGAVAATNNGPPGGMVAVADNNVEDIRPSGLSTTVGEADLEDAIYVSEHASTTEVSIVTEKQADAVAQGASPSAVAGDAVCGSPASGKATEFDCGTSFTLVISDDVHHDGRRVAIRTSVLEESLGYVPEFLTIRNNESGQEYRAPASVEDGWLVAYTEGYSSNSVTWSGEVNITASPASDGSQWQYDTKDIDSVSDPLVDLTGVLNSEYDNVSASGVSPDYTTTISVGGNREPVNATGDDPTVVVTAHHKDVTDNAINDEGDGTTSDAGKAFGDDSTDDKIKSEFKVVPDRNRTVERLKLHVDQAGGGDYNPKVDVYIVQESKPDTTYAEGTLVKDNWDASISAGIQLVDISDYSVTAGKSYTIAFVTTASNADGGANQVFLSTDNSLSGTWRSRFPGSYTYSEAGNITLVKGKNVTDLSVSDGAGHSHSFSHIADGETRKINLNVTTATTELNFTGSGNGTIDVELRMQERTETVDPGVEINGHWLNHTGTLSDGETVSLTGNSSWLVEGTNRVNLSVGDGTLSADAPNPQVGLTYSHDAKSKVSVDYTAEKWTERYNVSRTWAGDRQTANLTIPFEGTVVAVRDITVYSNGTKVSPQSTSFDGTTLTVELGSVDLNETTRVVANASKVQVSNGAITVLEPTMPGDRLDSKIRVTSANTTEDLIISVGGTDGGRLIHYSYNESWSGADEYAMFTGKSAQDLVLPDAAGGSEFRVSTIPVRIGLSSSSADVAVEVSDPRVTEPKFSVTPGASSGDSVSFTFVSAQDSETYTLYSLSRKVGLDSGTANSPLTLEDDDSDEIIEFRLEDDGTSDDDDDGGGGTKNPEEVTVKAGGAAVTVETTAFIGALAALMVGIWFVTNNFGDSGGISDKTLFYGIGVLAVTMGIETLSPAGLVGTVFGTLSTFIGKGLARAMPLVILVLGYLGYRYFKTRGKPQKVVNFQLGGGKGGT